MCTIVAVMNYTEQTPTMSVEKLHIINTADMREACIHIIICLRMLIKFFFFTVYTHNAAQGDIFLWERLQSVAFIMLIVFTTASLYTYGAHNTKVRLLLRFCQIHKGNKFIDVSDRER